MKQSWRLLVALFLVFALVAAACGDDEEDTTTEPTADDGGDGAEEPADDGAEEPADDGAEEPADDGAEEPADDGAEEPADGGGDEGAIACGPGGVETPQTTVDGTSSGDGSALTIGLVHNGRGDGSFNDSAVAGLDAAIADFGITPQEVVVNLTGGETGATEVETLAGSGTDYNVLVGFLLGDAAAAAATAFPDAQFGIIDSVVDAPNVQGLVFAEEQGSFLVGVAAALNTQTDTVGFIGGVGGFGLIEKFEAGFQAGVHAVNPDITIISQYITQAPDFDGFVAPDRGREIALAMYDQGADVVYHAAGASGAGLFEAAAEQSESSGSKVWAIGVDSDQYNTSAPEVRDYILTSMLKRVDNAVFEITRAQADGSFQSGNVVYDLSVDGVGYSTTGDFLTEEQITTIEDYKAQIIDGTIVVPTVPEGA